ncbi:MAG: tetratricopeptide repeat protein [bacterium]
MPAPSPGRARRSAPPTASDPLASPRATAFVVAALVATVAAVLAPVLGARAIGLDDPLLVVANPLVRTPGWEGVARAFAEVLRPSTMDAYYMPLSLSSLALDAVWGGSASNLVPFHVTNLVLHLVATVLAFVVLRRLVGSTAAAALAALVYGVHPVMVEAVASAGERKTVLSTALAFACLVAHGRALDGGGARARVASVVLFALALLAKPAVLTLPLVLVLLGPRPWFDRAAWRGVVPHLALAAVSGAISSASVRATWEFVAPPPLDLADLVLKALWLPAHYAALWVWPARTSTVHQPPSPFELSNPVVLAGVGATLAIAALAWVLRRRTPLAVKGLVAFALLLLPTYGILRFSPMISYERYLHLPAIGFALVIAAALAAGLRRGQRVLAVGLALVVAAGLAVGARRALEPWRDSLALWTRAVEVAPGMAASHNGLGATLSDAGDDVGAEPRFERAVAVDPGYGDGHYNLGRARVRLGRPADALAPLERAAALLPGSEAVALQRGLAFNMLGRPVEAERELRRALELRPDYALAWAPLGVARTLQGDAEGGLEALRRAADATGEPGPRVMLAAALIAHHGPDAEAVALLERAVADSPDLVPALNELAWLRATAADPVWRDSAQALAYSQRALAAAGGSDPGVLDTRAAAEAAAGRYADAVTTARRALDGARALGDSALVVAIESRLAAYRRGVPWRETPRRR